MSDIKWENQIGAVPANDIMGGLNKAGLDGWEPWWILGPLPQQEGMIAVAIKRPKRLVSIATSLPSRDLIKV